MRSDGSSKTAYAVALQRATHQVRDHPKVFDDPLAVSILGPEARLYANLPLKLDGRRRAFMVARCRCSEDQLARASWGPDWTSRPAGSGVAFDYTLARPAMGPRMRAGQKLIAMAVARLGEPFRSAFVPADLARLLRELGFRELEDLSPADIDRRYFASRDDGLKVGNVWGHVASAWL